MLPEALVLVSEYDVLHLHILKGAMDKRSTVSPGLEKLHFVFVYNAMTQRKFLEAISIE